MGDPLLLANQIPTDILILLQGQIRQIINNPVNGEIMTLGLQKPPYVIGFKSCKAAFPLEFVTAADECQLARIKYKDWINLITLYSDNNSIQSKVFPDEILPFLIENNKVLFSKKVKAIRTYINKLADSSSVIEVSNTKEIQQMKLDVHKKWYLASNLEFMPYGTDLEISDNLKILKENSKTFRIIGVPKKINEKPIEEKDINTKKKIRVT